jgi:hypothetical protein
VGAGITGGITLSRASDIKDACDGDDCPPSQADKLDNAKTLGTVTNVLIGVAAVGVVAGVVLYFVEPGLGEDEPAVSVSPTASADGAGLVLGGRF